MSHDRDKYADLEWVFSALHNMIDETMYHMKTFAHTLEVHHNKEAAQIFSLAYVQFQKEEEIVTSHSSTKNLPTIAPWETFYSGYVHPSEVLGETDYLMTQEEAWKAIGQISRIHTDFYDFLGKESENNALLKLTKELMEHCKHCETTHQKEMIDLHPDDTLKHDDLDLIPRDDFKGMFQ